MILLFFGCLILLVSSLITHSTFIVLSASILGFLASFLSAKGKVMSQFLSIMAMILFLIISLPQKYYGEAIIIIFITLPIRIGTISSWLKHKDEKRQIVEANNIRKNEWKLIAIGTAFLFITLYFLLKYLHTSQLLVSTFSAITSIISSYLLMRRNKYSFFFAVINDVFRLILWFIPTMRGDWSLLTLVINRLIYLSVDLYGYLNWIKFEKNNINYDARISKK
jgi:nicotinamide mononucleotide transporter PnuC